MINTGVNESKITGSGNWKNVVKTGTAAVHTKPAITATKNPRRRTERRNELTRPLSPSPASAPKQAVRRLTVEPSAPKNKALIDNTVLTRVTTPRFSSDSSRPRMALNKKFKKFESIIAPTKTVPEAKIFFVQDGTGCGFTAGAAASRAGRATAGTARKCRPCLVFSQ